MSVGQSFNRLAVMKVFQRKESTDSNGVTILNDIDKEGKEFRSRMQDGSPGFRIAFSVDKVHGEVPIANKSQIRIWNLGGDSRAFITKQNNLVVLEAGYGDQTTVVLAGNLQYAKTQKEGPDYVTMLDVIDGGHAFQNATVEQSFKGQTSIQSVINSLVSTLKGSGITSGTMQGIPTQSFNNGVVLSGKAVDQLKQVCEKNNLQFTIQDQKIVILPYGFNNGLPVIFLSPETGLIGIPELRGEGLASPRLNTGAPKANEEYQRTTSTVAFKCLMNPQIGLFQPIVIQSKFVNGGYNVVKVVHDGDSFSGPWFSQCEAVGATSGTA